MLINRNPQDQWQSSIAAKGLSHTGILVLPLFLYQTFKEVQLPGETIPEVFKATQVRVPGCKRAWLLTGPINSAVCITFL